MDSDSTVLEWQVVNKFEETPSTYTYVFSTGKKFNFAVGQFVMLGTNLNRPNSSGEMEENWVERAYSLASSPTRDLVEITIKAEKPYGYVNPGLKKPDGFASYFTEQIKIGDKVKVKLGQKKDHFLSRIAAGLENDIAYWSGANGAESARSLIQLMEDKPELGLKLILFYSNPRLYISENERTVNVIYYNWLIEKAKKLENLKVIFTFTRDNEVLVSDNPRVVFRKGRFFVAPDGAQERTLSKYRGSVQGVFNPICGSSGFVNGVVQNPDGTLGRGRGILQDLIETEGVKPEKIDKEQFYIDHAHTS